MKEFTTALEAREIVDDLERQSRKLNYNPQYKKFIHNLNKMVSDLSIAEVSSRQHKKPSITDKPRQELAKSIIYFEQLLLIQALSQ